jgi:mRNA interferase RelE/StbE
MFNIQLTKRACAFLRRLQTKQVLQIKAKLLSLQANPTPQDSRKLIGYPHYYRTSVGEYRIVYRLENDTVFIHLIGKRNDSEIYKQLSRCS